MFMNLMVRYVWLLLLVPAALAGGCMSGRADLAAISQDGRVLVFKDCHGLYVVDGNRTRRLGFTLGQLYLSEDGDRLVWFDGLSEQHCSMVLYHPHEDRRDEVQLPGNERSRYPDAVMFGSSGRLMLKFVVYPNPPPGSSVVPPTPPDLSAGVHEPPPAKPETRFYCWSAKTRWTRGDQPMKGFMPPAHTDGYYGFMGIAPKRLDEPNDAREFPLVEFGADGWNARRTVWVRPNGSVLEISRQNDILGKALVNIAAFPLLFWDYWYLGALVNSPQEACSDLKVTDNSAAQAKLDRLVRERTKGASRQGSQAATGQSRERSP